MKKILIFGAGSIGNHMTNAALKIKCKVHITDIKFSALERMKKFIFPSRYGRWNNSIEIIDYKEVFFNKNNFDLVIIGTPPNTHVKLFREIQSKIKFKKILIEKPISHYLDKNVNKILLSHNKKNKNIYCGYNHSVNNSFKYFYDKANLNIKKINFIDVEWKENFKGILGAHPWLKNQFDSYLGSTYEGGGSLQEHSHGLHLLNVILKLKKIKLNNLKFHSNLIFKKDKKKKYDCYCNIVGMSKNLFIRYETDLLTWPAQKKVKISGDNYKLSWQCNYKKNTDRVVEEIKGKVKKIYFPKSRSQEFENELQHLLNMSTNNYKNSFLNLENALDVKNFFLKILNEK